MTTPFINCFQALTRFVYPLSLRERVSFVVNARLDLSKIHSSNVPLYFNSAIRLDLESKDIGHRQIILNGFYELHLTRKILSLASEGGLLVDVGANFGYFSSLWAAIGQNKVIAFEANPSNVAPLQNNIIRNDLADKVKIEAVALGKEKSVMKFFLGAQSQTGWGGLMKNDFTGDTVDVEVISLDDYCRGSQIDRIHVLKIDTEGADTWIMQGATNLLKERKINHLFFEQNGPRMEQLGISLNEPTQFLKSVGYSVEALSPCEFYAKPL